MPTVLLVVNFLYRHVAARLPYAFSKAGFSVKAIFPSKSLVSLSDYVDGGFSYSGSISVERLLELICEIQSRDSIDIIVPCDEAAAYGLDIMRSQPCRHPFSDAVKNLLCDWQSGFDATARTRSAAVDVVRGMGLRTPRQVPLVPNTTTATDLSGLGSPVVVKQDHSNGGYGVSLVSTPHEALNAASQMSRRANVLGEGRIVAQEFIAGRPASVSFSAREGRILEAFAYVAIHQYPEPAGAASVLSLIEHPELLDAARRIVEGFGYSGFGGVDFILPPDGSAPVFLELNARPTQTTHLGSLFGADLCRAMACSLAGEPYTGAFNIAGLPPIAMFPNEWLRDRNSPHLLRSHHDVPWHERRVTAFAVQITPELHQ